MNFERSHSSLVDLSQLPLDHERYLGQSALNVKVNSTRVFQCDTNGAEPLSST